jgi:hypothetical protein
MLPTVITDLTNFSPGDYSSIDTHVEGLNCNRLIQCLASSQILTSPPLTARLVYTPPPPPPLVRGGGITRWVERGGGGVNILEDGRHCAVFYICKYFVNTHLLCCAQEGNLCSDPMILLANFTGEWFPGNILELP